LWIELGASIISADLSYKKLLRFVDYLYVQYSYMVLSRFKGRRLDIPRGKTKGVILSFDVETWDNKCGGFEESSADPREEYYKYLPGLLDLLKDYSIPAHFFVCGKALELFPEVFKILLKGGHGIGGHGYSHEKLYNLSSEEQRGIVRKVRTLLNEKLCVGLKSWRSPGLASNRETYRVLNECGVKFCSNAPWGRPMLIEGVCEVPMVRKMDNHILGCYGARKCPSPKRWADYMKRKFESARRGILVFGMHTWIQKKYDPKYEALTHFLNFLESHRNEVWVGSLDNL
jgi:peptidoglycan/xylan/chitin deacetylase (PgdA/CDA1 family)